MPSDAPDAWARRAQCFLIATYRVFSQEEFETNQANAEHAKQRAGEIADPGSATAIVPEGAGQSSGLATTGALIHDMDQDEPAQKCQQQKKHTLAET